MTYEMDQAYMENFVGMSVEELYGIKGEIGTIVRGVDTTFSVTETGNVVAYARLYGEKRRSLSSINAEMSTLNAITRGLYFDVSRPIANLAGHQVSKLSFLNGSECYIALFKPAHGRKICYTNNDISHFGRSLAEFHSNNVVEKSSHTAYKDRASAHIEIISNKNKHCAHSFSSAIDEIKHAEHKILSVGNGLCHGDVRIENARIDEERVNFFDFEDSFYGPQIIDLASMAFWLEASGVPNCDKYWTTFLKAYGITNFNDIETSIRYYFVLRQVQLISFLISFCELDDKTWNMVYQDGIDMANKARSGHLRIIATNSRN